ncbi:MAG: response regulator [Lachnospiraceae bacterium]
MKTSEIINNICSHLGIAKSDLAKRMGLHPSSLYRKLSKESMTFEELQKCLDVLGVSVELQFQYPDGGILSSQANHEQLIDRMDILEKKLEAADKVDEFRKKSLRDLRTELNSAVGYAELCRKHGSQMDSYLNKLSNVHSSMERTISFALGDSFNDETDEIDAGQIEALQGKRVLLVDDNDLNCEILEEVLLDHGLLFEEAANGSKALSAVQEHAPGYYQFILMDIEMPEMDGFEATLRIRKLPNRIRANTPIIAFTANAVSENRDRAFAVGMDGFLVKPVNTSRLLASLVKFL